ITTQAESRNSGQAESSQVEDPGHHGTRSWYERCGECCGGVIEECGRCCERTLDACGTCCPNWSMRARVQTGELDAKLELEKSMNK
ncbi:hypothetical protein QYM36_018242, partial [Artemia franciscana]